MKKIIFALVFLGFIGGAYFIREHFKQTKVEEREDISHYTCPMHPQIHEDHPGECPICHMKLVPVRKGREAPGGGDKKEGLLVIPPERQQRIGLTTAPVTRRGVVRQVRTLGRVAFDPDLAAAQEEYLEIAAGVPSFREAALSRLKIMGMGEEEIRDLEERGEVDHRLFLPAEGEAVWVYASLYENELGGVHPGQEANLIVPSSGEGFVGTIRAVDPVLDPTTRTARARIEVPGAGGKLKPEIYLTVLIESDLGEQIVVPKSAVIDTGARQIAFVVHGGTDFEARELRLGPEAGDDRVILEGLKEGEVVAKSALFLIDSESQLKAAIAGMEGHQH